MKNIKNLLHVLLIFIGLLSLNAQAGVEITYIHNDALGSPVAGTDEQGNVKWRSHYQPYGEELLGERQLFGVRTGYTGHRDDPETGLTYMGARYYSPMIGRFMGVDPAGVNESNLHSFNRYAYANNNPYKYVDPDGEIPLLFLIPLVLKAVDAGFTAYDTYTAYQEEGASGAAQELGTSAALSVVPGAKILGKVGKQVTNGGRKLPFNDAGRLAETNKTLDRIETGEPFHHKQDGSVFRNREGKLPKGDYREYTVDTPGASNRGARRVVQDQKSGGTYYTDDHYKNFTKIDPKKHNAD